MLIGLCSSAVADPARISASGIDYIEDNVQSFLAPESPQAEFETRLQQSRLCGKPIAAVNCFLPGELKCVGPAVDEARVLRYASSACLRAKLAGIGIIVFGSGGARTLPEGASTASAHAQFAALLRRLGPIAQAQGVVLAVEPLNRGECNFINTIQEGSALVHDVGHAHIRLLVDIYHMLKNDETPEDMRYGKGLVVHAHIAERDGRTAPGTKGEDLRGYLRALHAMGYEGRISLEGSWKDCYYELPHALQALRAQLADAGYTCKGS
jgi:sugar phosphate isomerase/epimerase